MTTTQTVDNTARQNLSVFLSSQRGTASEKILAAWDSDMNAALTTKAIMDATGLSRTTVNTNLSKLAQNGGVIRFDNDKVTTWSLTPTRKAALKRAAKKAATTSAKVTTKKTSNGKVTGLVGPRKAVASTKGKTTVTDENTENAQKPTRTATGRRAKGAIDAEILGFFQSTGNEPAGSYAVANAIGSSKGAAYVAMNRMTKEGTLTQVGSEPSRYIATA
jgi:predicted transcriptional regulator